MTAQAQPIRRLLTVRDAAARLSVPVWRCYELARLNVLPVVRLGRQIRIDPAKLDDFIARGGFNYTAEEVAGVRAQAGFRRR